MKTLTFATQAAAFLLASETRKRNPVRPATLATYRYSVENHLNPVLGKYSLENVGNKELRSLVEKLAAEKLSPATITLNVNIAKQIVASAVNQNGDQLFPRTWNSDFMDLPVISAQKRPIADAQAVAKGISGAPTPENALIALLAGSGLRIQEALALQVVDNGVNTFWDRLSSRIIVRQQRDGAAFGPVKTTAGVREVDLCKELNDYLEFRLEPFFSEIHASSGCVFPKSENFYRTKLNELGILGGFHSLRRFRTTHLRLASVPEPIVHFWIGHADQTVTDLYTQVGEKIEARKQHAERAGLGFSLEEA
jgi:integrase